VSDSQPDDDDTPRLPAELEQMLRGLTGGELPPELASMMQGMGLDKVDPQMLAMVMGQVQAMFAAPESDSAVNAVLATDIARKTVAAEGDQLASAADGRAAAEAVQVAGMWLDAVTDLTTAGLVGAAWSSAEWVEATMPVWTDLVEPVAAGVTDAVGTALTGQLGQLGELGDSALPEGMLDQAGPMLRRMHGSMFSMQLGQGTGTLAREVLTGCEVSLPLVPAPSPNRFCPQPGEQRRAVGDELRRPGRELDDRGGARPGGARRRGHQQRRPLLLGAVLEPDPSRGRQARPLVAEIERDQIEAARAQHQIRRLRRHVGRAADPQQATQRDPGRERAPRIQPAPHVDQRRRLARRDGARQRRVQDRRPPRRPPPDQLAQRRPRPPAPQQPIQRRDPAAAPPPPVLQPPRRDQMRQQSRIQRRPRRHPNETDTERMSRST